MTFFRRVLPCLLPVLLLAACAAQPPRTDATCVALGPGSMCLLAPASLPALEATHLVRIRHDGKDNVFLGRLAIDAARLRLSASSLMGMHLFGILWDGHAVRRQPLDASAHADMIVAMLELALASPQRLEPQLNNLQLTVADHADDAQTRTLRTGGQLVATIRRTGRPGKSMRLAMTIPRIDLTLTITPLDPS